MANWESKVPARWPEVLAYRSNRLATLTCPTMSGRLVPSCGSVLKKRRGTEGMVVVPVGVDHITDGKIGEGPQLVNHTRAIGEQPGVDDGNPLGTDDDGGVPEASQKVHPGGDLTALIGCSDLPRASGPALWIGSASLLMDTCQIWLEPES